MTHLKRHLRGHLNQSVLKGPAGQENGVSLSEKQPEEQP